VNLGLRQRSSRMCDAPHKALLKLGLQIDDTAAMDDVRVLREVEWDILSGCGEEDHSLA
jgi:hypothetical protein